MSRTFDNTGKHGLTTSTGITATPLSIFCRFRATNNDIQSIGGIWNGASDTFDGFYVETGITAGSVKAVTAAASSFGTATSSAGYSNNVWNSCLAVFTNSTSRDIYLNGANKGSNTTDLTPSSLSRVAIAKQGKLTLAGAFGGDLADFALWNAALNIDEALALHNGVNARRIRPGNLVDDFPIWGLSSPEVNFGPTPGRTITLTGSPPKNTHSIATLWTPKWATVPLIEAAAAGLSIPVAMHSYRQHHQSGV